MLQSTRRPAIRRSALLLIVAIIAVACGADTTDPSQPPIVIGSRTPTAAPSESPAAATDPWSVPFMSRPASEPILRRGGCDNLVIEGLSFQDLGPDVEAIHLERCNNVTIRANDFARVAQAITIEKSTDVKIEWNRYLDITGPHERVRGLNRANFVQLDQVTGGYVSNNKGRGGDTEDIVSLFRSGGTAESPFIVEYNHFQGTDWVSPSGSGIALGDATSGHSIARYNTLLDPGQVGIFIAGGTDHKIIGNTIVGRRRPFSNVGLYVWSQSSEPCANNEVRDNEVLWTKADGTANPAWDGGNCGAIVGWEENDFDADLDPTALEVEL